MTSFTIRSTSAAFLLLGLAAGGSLKAEGLTAADWTDSSTDSSGNYAPTPPASQNGNGVSGAIQTDANQSFPDNEVTNYLRTGSDPSLALATGGDTALLGDLTSYTGLSATFNITNSTLAAGAQFTASEIVGETIPGNAPPPTNSTIRLVFTGANPLDPSSPDEWWSNPVAAVVTSMSNGVDVTISNAFDPSLWSNVNGLLGTNPLVAGQFEEALADVTKIGLSFGSGDFFSDGFAFNTGGTAEINLDAITTTPEPSTWILLGSGGLLLFLVQRRRSIFVAQK